MPIWLAFLLLAACSFLYLLLSIGAAMNTPTNATNVVSKGAFFVGCGSLGAAVITGVML